MSKLLCLMVSFLAIILAAPGFAQTCTADAECEPRGPGFECNDSSQCEWIPPIGIPRPEFGIEETHYMYAGQHYEAGGFDYNDAGNGPYSHYVDNTDGLNCTNDDNPYGTEANPRCRIPLGLPPGSVVEVHGGVYTSGGRITGTATITQPIFVRGPDINNKPVFNTWMEIIGTYIILENINSDGNAGTGNGGIKVEAPSHHVAVRHSEVQNRVGGPTTALSVGTYTGQWVHDVVCYNNLAHDTGDWQATTDEDHIAIGVGRHSYNVWILDNEVWHASADGTGINADAASYLTHHIYVGRNVYHDNKQGGIWVKHAEDVIISENEVYSIRPTPSASSGAAMGYQYDPKRVWFLFNYIHNTTTGINSGSCTFCGVIRWDAYLIGNVIHDVETAGININNGGADSVNMIIGNTIYDVGIGIENGYYPSNMDMSNNLIANVSEYHIKIPADHGTPGNSDINYSLFDTPVQINWGETLYTSVAEFQTETEKCAGCIEEDPLFLSTDPASPDFLKIGPGSPAVNAGIESDVYQTFWDTYYDVFNDLNSLDSLDIRKGFDGNPRTGAWDIGAFEAEETDGCVSLELLLEYIDQWKQGSLSMPYLIDRIAAWKAGTGC